MRINPLSVVFWLGIYILCALAWGWAGLGWALIVSAIASAVIDSIPTK